MLASALVWTSCQDDEKKPLDIPTAYERSTYQANTTDEYALRNQLDAFINEAKKGRTTGVTVEASVLNQLYQAGSPSLQSVTTTYFNDRLTGASGWIQELSNASGNSYVLGPPVGQGGDFGGYLFDENGLEP